MAKEKRTKDKLVWHLSKLEKLYTETLENIRKVFRKREASVFYALIQDEQDYITALTVSDSHLDELSEELRYNIPLIDSWKTKCVANDDWRRIIFEIGRLYGTMQLSSRICYEKKKDNQVYETALSICGIRHFEEIISLLYNQRELTQTELCKDLQMKPSALSECIKKILDTNMIVCRRSGKYKVYTLTDDGLRFAKMRQQELNHEKKISSEIGTQYYNAIPSDNAGNEDSKEIKNVLPAKTEYEWALSSCFESISKDDKYENDFFNDLIIEKRGGKLCTI